MKTTAKVARHSRTGGRVDGKYRSREGGYPFAASETGEKGKDVAEYHGGGQDEFHVEQGGASGRIGEKGCQ